MADFETPRLEIVLEPERNEFADCSGVISSAKVLSNLKETPK